MKLSPKLSLFSVLLFWLLNQLGGIKPKLNQIGLSSTVWAFLLFLLFLSIETDMGGTSGQTEMKWAWPENCPFTVSAPTPEKTKHS